jgi:hypothetical protein
MGKNGRDIACGTPEVDGPLKTPSGMADQPAENSLCDRLRPTGDRQFPEHVLDVVFYGELTDPEDLADFPVALTRRDPLKNLALARGNRKHAGFLHLE